MTRRFLLGLIALLFTSGQEVPLEASAEHRNLFHDSLRLEPSGWLFVANKEQGGWDEYFRGPNSFGAALAHLRKNFDRGHSGHLIPIYEPNENR